MITFISETTDGVLVDSHLNFFVFPGGEPHIVERETSANETLKYAFITGCDGNELVMLGMAADYANKTGEGLTVFMPYLPGARADRGVPFGAEVYAKILNSFSFKQIICVDPHSPVMPSLLKSLTEVHLLEVLKLSPLINNVYDAVISPDAGALQRAQEVADFLNIPVVHAGKHREPITNKLSGFTCEPLPNPNGKYLIVDDICDSGGTFIGLADQLNLSKEQLHVWVTHGIFGKKAFRLKEKFDQIFTTNSHPGCYNPEVDAQVVDLLPFFLRNMNGWLNK